jgi:gluconate 2-dehydrogenase gamma chain
MNEAKQPEFSRRKLIVSSAFVPLAALTVVSPEAAQTTARPVATALSSDQMRILEAFVERLIPHDDLGPSAAEAGAQIYIDRALAGPNSGEKQMFLDGLAAMDAYARRTQGEAFAELEPEKRDAVMTAMDDGTAEGFENARQFFARARRLTLEGMFGDPYYGGNKNFAGWDLIRYPGPLLAVGPEEQKLDKAPPRHRRSAYGPPYGH